MGYKELVESKRLVEKLHDRLDRELVYEAVFKVTPSRSCEGRKGTEPVRSNDLHFDALSKDMQHILYVFFEHAWQVGMVDLPFNFIHELQLSVMIIVRRVLQSGVCIKQLIHSRVNKDNVVSRYLKGQAIEEERL